MITPEIKTKMLALKALASSVLNQLKREGDKANMGAVNWGDLNVVEVLYYVNDRGDTGYTITIEEAAPGAKLAMEVWERMGKPTNVEVVCEW